MSIQDLELERWRHCDSAIVLCCSRQPWLALRGVPKSWPLQPRPAGIWTTWSWRASLVLANICLCCKLISEVLSGTGPGILIRSWHHSHNKGHFRLFLDKQMFMIKPPRQLRQQHRQKQLHESNRQRTPISKDLIAKQTYWCYVIQQRYFHCHVYKIACPL